MQSLLFDPLDYRTLETLAQARNLCGMYFEQKTAEFLGGSVIKIQNQREHNPDVKALDRDWEVKSVGHNGYAVLYPCRLAKEERLNPSLHYALWHHKLKVAGLLGLTFNEIFKRLEAETKFLLLTPSSVIREIALTKKVSEYQSEYGRQDRDKLYRTHIKLTLKEIEQNPLTERINF